MAGGVGTRFWPHSRRKRPKQLLPITGSKSMLRLTVARILELAPTAHTWVVTGAEQAEAVRAELPELPADHVLVEPQGRNTAACIGLAACVLDRIGAGDEPMLVLPADHAIADEDRFRSVLHAGAEFVQHHDVLLTLGIRPTRPETGYGYIRRGPTSQTWSGWRFDRVERFVEKPDAETAQALVADGLHMWNSGMFLWRPRRILAELSRFVPALAPGLERLATAWGTSTWWDRLQQEYAGFPSISIDYAVMEKAAEVWVAEIDIGWNDVGSWASLPEVRGADAQHNVLPPGSLGIEAERNIVEASGKTVVLLGVSDLVIVDSPDALLVCRRDLAQRVGQIPERLRAAGLESLT
jgi:mannose-1-phosphate guanylyltransferase